MRRRRRRARELGKEENFMADSDQGFHEVGIWGSQMGTGKSGASGVKRKEERERERETELSN